MNKFLLTWLRSMPVVLALTISMVCAGAASAQFVMMPDSTNNRLVLFDPFNGSVVNPSAFSLQAGTPIHAMQVGTEIWVSEQVGDRISRWDFSGNHLGNIGGQFAGGGLDNIRGMAQVGNTIYVSNSGTNNSAPGNSVVMFDTSGNNMGFFSTTGLAPSPFAILPHQGGLLVASSAAGDDIHRFTLAGSSLGTFHDSTSLNFAQQMAVAANGNILAAGFSSNNIAVLDPNTGALVNSLTASGARGVFQLGNGNILWSNGSGAHIYDVVSGTSSLVYAGGGRHFGLYANVIPEPSSLGLIGALAGMGLFVRRRRKHG